MTNRQHPQYEIEMDSQDEYYENPSERGADVTMRTVPSEVRSVVKRKGRGFSAEEPTTQALSDIKHFDTLREEVSGRAQRCITRIHVYTFNVTFVSCSGGGLGRLCHGVE